MSFNCTDKDTLISYLYDECDVATRASVDAHLAACCGCADEVAGFGRVRETLSEWAPPARIGGFRLVRDEEPVAATARVLRPARWWQSSVPALARVAAAILLFAGGAALANLEVRYDKDGFVVRTGWQKAASGASTVPAQAVAVPASQPSAAPAASDAPDGARAAWRSEMAALERQLRDDFRQQLAAASKAAPPARTQAVAGNVSFDENRFMQRVYAALDESERRQQVNVATYMSRLVSDMQAGRSIDMRRIGFDALPPALPQQQRPKNDLLFGVSWKK